MSVKSSTWNLGLTVLLEINIILDSSVQYRVGFQGNYYMWGVFRSKRNESSSAAVQDVTVSNTSNNHMPERNEVNSGKVMLTRVKSVDSMSPQSPLSNYRIFSVRAMTKISDVEANLEQFKSETLASQEETRNLCGQMQESIDRNKVEADKQFAEIMQQFKALRPAPLSIAMPASITPPATHPATLPPPLPHHTTPPSQYH
ncbi:hypothetical protein Tco_0109990 [Tanacetum coccineum]